MAFLPEKTYLEESVITAYDLSTGSTSFVSSDISKFTSFSLQFILTNADGNNTFRLEQSNDNSNWSSLNGDVDLPVGSTNFVIDKAFFSGKYIKIEFITTGGGVIDCLLIAKR